MILDGFGYSPIKKNNAIAQAKTPNIDQLMKNYPHGLLKASGLDVGLPKGIMGNSEVGHTNIGAGRVVYQDLTRIEQSIKDGSFLKNAEINKAFDLASKKGGKVHLMGLLSDGGVHSHIKHVEEIIKIARKRKFKNLVLHPIFDGRDTAPQIGETFLKKLLSMFKKYGTGELGSLAGRYYTMDRDTRWDRIKKGYDAMVTGSPLMESDPIQYIKEQHKKGMGDEFIKPVCCDLNNTIQDNDTVIFFNFRSDRARQITRALTEKKFKGFKLTKKPKLAYFVCMTEYDKTFKLPVAFPAPELKNTLGELVSREGLRQLRIAETEKYAHVTFFFNGGSEVKFKNEDRILIESPRDVETYDQKPEMSARGITARLLTELDKDKYDLIIMNFANCDMVGHTGKFNETVNAIEVVDECVGKIVTKALGKKGVVLLTADHGNAELMRDKDGKPITSHTTNPVPLLIISEELKNSKKKVQNGQLADVMPTLLHLMKIKVPKEITGKDLLK